MKRFAARLAAVRVLLVEIAVYGVLVATYLIFVLRALRPWLVVQARGDRGLYAALCVLLMLGQGVLLEIVTTFLVRRFRGARDDS
jgi:hypothetical protein